jgi:hypothetical protein
MYTSCVAFAKEIKGNGKMETKSITISDFSEVEIETHVEINYSQEKNTGKAEFTVDQNLWEYYNIHTKGNVLYVELKKEYRNNVNLKPTKVLLTVSSEKLERIENAGSSKFNFCTNFVSDKLEIELAGSGKINANKFPVKIKELDIEIAGSGNVNLSGAVQAGIIEIAGSGNVNALNCKIARLSVEIAGSGNVEATVTDTLDVEIAGSGNVNFKGNPEVTTDIAGSGRVKKI